MKPKSLGLKLTHAAGLLGTIGTLLIVVQQQNVLNAQNLRNPPVHAHRSMPKDDAPLSPIETQWGIRLQGIRLSAAGNLLDFRYRILDVDKAQALVDRKSQPYLMNQMNGTRTSVPTTPTLGALRQSSQKPLADHTYFILFANPGRQIKTGDKVTVTIGDFKAENLMVE